MADDILTPDFDVWPITRRPRSARVEDDVVVVTWQGGGESRFNTWWLIDNSPMPEHINRDTREPTLDLSTLPDVFRAETATVDASGTLYVTWSDGVSPCHYHAGWLAAHDIDSGGFRGDDRPAPQHWDAAALEAPPSLDGAAILQDDDALAAWLDAVAVWGIGRLHGVSSDPGTVQRVAERIGTPRATNFGLVFDVQSKIAPDTNAYTALELTPHVDLPTREYQPGLQILHCLENTATGGEAVMVDGFRLADALAEDDAAAFAVLCDQPFDFANRARSTDYRWRSPVIVRETDPAAPGRYREVRVAGFLRGPLAMPAEAVGEAYRALRRMFALSREPRFQLRFTYRPGDLVLFDNRRLLHGRTAFDPTAGERWLQGIYLERDELYSRIRVLRRQSRQRAADLMQGAAE